MSNLLLKFCIGRFLPKEKHTGCIYTIDFSIKSSAWEPDYNTFDGLLKLQSEEVKGLKFSSDVIEITGGDKVIRVSMQSRYMNLMAWPIKRLVTKLIIMYARQCNLVLKVQKKMKRMFFTQIKHENHTMYGFMTSND